MTQGVPIDRQAVHQEIWEARTRNGTCKIYQKKFAAHLKISVYQMSRIIKELEKDGKITKIGSRYRNVGIYKVSDPASFTAAGGSSDTGLNDA